MKRILCVIIAVMLLSGCAMTVAAHDQYSTMYDLWQSWAASADADFYPDGVCGVWSTYGDGSHLTVMVTDDARGRAARDAILEQVSDHSTLDFVTGKYTFHELWEVNSAVYELADKIGIKDCGICWWAVSETRNRVEVGVFFDAPGASEFAEMLEGRFGDMVTVEESEYVVEEYSYTYTDGKSYVIDGDGYKFPIGTTRPVMPGKGMNGITTANSSGESRWHWYYCLVPLLVLLLGAAGVFLHLTRNSQRGARRVVAVMSGGEVTVPAPVSVEEKIRSAVVEPSGKCDSEILSHVKS